MLFGIAHCECGHALFRLVQLNIVWCNAFLGHCWCCTHEMTESRFFTHSLIILWISTTESMCTRLKQSWVITEARVYFVLRASWHEFVDFVKPQRPSLLSLLCNEVFVAWHMVWIGYIETGADIGSFWELASTGRTKEPICLRIHSDFRQVRLSPHITRTKLGGLVLSVV